jgi:hypothetical protein
MLMRCAVFGVTTQRRVVILFGTTYRSLFKDQELQTFSWPLKMGPIRCPERSVKDCHSMLRNIPKQCRSQERKWMGGNLFYHPLFFKCANKRRSQLLRLYCVGKGWPRHYGSLMGWCLQGKTEALGEKILSVVTLSTTNPTWTGLRSNQGHVGDRLEA